MSPPLREFTDINACWGSIQVLEYSRKSHIAWVYLDKDCSEGETKNAPA